MLGLHWLSARKAQRSSSNVMANIWFAFGESGWSPPENPEIVGLRAELHRRVKQAEGKWNPTKRVRKINYDQAVALDLKKRVVKPEVSDIRLHQTSNTNQPRVSSTRRQCPVLDTSD
jgi:hypothetical protein